MNQRKRGRVWSRKKIVSMLREIKEREKPINPYYLHKHYTNLYAAIKGGLYFKNWGEAVKAAGFDPDEEIKEYKKQKWCKEKVIKEILRLEAQGEPLNSAYLREKHGGLHNAMWCYFDGWKDAIRSAGLDIRKEALNIWLTKQEVVEQLKQLKLQGLRLNSDFLREDYQYLYSSMIYHFESYIAAIEATGCDPNEESLRERWSKENVFYKTRQLIVAKGFLKPTQIRGINRKLYHAGFRYFKEWNWKQILQNANSSLNATSNGPYKDMFGLFLGLSKNGEDKDIINQLVEINWGLVYKLAKKYQRFGMDVDDLAQEGFLGLMTAIEKFNPFLGYTFSTYAYWWIRQAIMRVIENQSRTIRIPVYANYQLLKIKRTINELMLRLERTPTYEEIAEELKIPLNQIMLLIKQSKTISLNMYVDENEETELGDFLFKKDDPLPDEVAISSFNKEQACEKIHEALDILNPKEQMVIIYRHGLFGEKTHTFKEVGKELGVTRQRIHQIEKKAIIKLRKSPEAKKLYKSLTHH